MGLKWFPWEGSGGDACESLRGNHCRPSSPGNDLVFVRCFLGRFMGLKWFPWKGSGGDACESLGGNHCRHHCWEMLLSLFWFPFQSLFGGLGGTSGSDVVSLGGSWEI